MPDIQKKVLFFARHDCAASEQGFAHLKACGFEIEVITSSHFGESLPDNIDWQGDYIFCLRSYFILPPSLIARARLAAINFHPAPPEYPGIGCINYALFDDATEYGVTAHLMTEKVDAGQIVQVTRFPILPQDDVASLLTRTHEYLFALFCDVTTALAQNPAQSPARSDNVLAEKLAQAQDETWRGAARQMSELNRAQIIDADISPALLARKFRAIHTESFPLRLFLHGFEFRLHKKIDEAEK